MVQRVGRRQPQRWGGQCVGIRLHVGARATWKICRTAARGGASRNMSSMPKRRVDARPSSTCSAKPAAAACGALSSPAGSSAAWTQPTSDPREPRLLLLRRRAAQLGPLPLELLEGRGHARLGLRRRLQLGLLLLLLRQLGRTRRGRRRLLVVDCHALPLPLRRRGGRRLLLRRAQRRAPLPLDRLARGAQRGAQLVVVRRDVQRRLVRLDCLRVEREQRERLADAEARLDEVWPQPHRLGRVGLCQLRDGKGGVGGGEG
ncbi:hypothetical protein AB1Y20_012074 [Prymnesium parvum]|uniref:Uncharacterized protein n=1 Tax=Prymnesium parvum TaxID=97485 RepID=A0AB34IQ70_PRYPA